MWTSSFGSLVPFFECLYDTENDTFKVFVKYYSAFYSALAGRSNSSGSVGVVPFLEGFQSLIRLLLLCIPNIVTSKT